MIIAQHAKARIAITIGGPSGIGPEIAAAADGKMFTPGTLSANYRGEKATGDKVTRVQPFVAQAAVGNVRLVRGLWSQDYLDELCAFSNGRH